MRRALGLLTSLMLATGMVARPVWACPTAEEGFRRLTAPDAEVAYRWEPGELKVGQFFAAEIVTCRTPPGEPVRAMAIGATMPAHGHGMNYRPSVHRKAPDHYRFEGLMLHMPGMWRLTIDLIQGPKRTRLTHEVDLTP